MRELEESEATNRELTRVLAISPRPAPGRISLFRSTSFGLHVSALRIFLTNSFRPFILRSLAFLTHFFVMPSPAGNRAGRRRYRSRSGTRSSSRSPTRSRSRSRSVRGVLDRRRRRSPSQHSPSPRHRRSPSPRRRCSPSSSSRRRRVSASPPPARRRRVSASPPPSRRRRVSPPPHRRSPSASPPLGRARRSRSRSDGRRVPARPIPEQERGPTMAYEEDPFGRIAELLRQALGPMVRYVHEKYLSKIHWSA